MKFLKGMIAAFGLMAVVAAPMAWAAGLWSTLPIVGGASFCASTVTGAGGLGGITGQGQASTGSICAQTVPAGPATLTGAELFPADTGLGNNGNVPATAVVTTCQLGGGSLTVLSPAAGNTGTLVIPNQTCFYVIDGAGTISAFTYTMPANPLDGQILRISSKVAVSTLTLQANTGQTLLGAPTSASANSAVGAWIYRAANTTWYRV
jgi:hypothetical protein